MLPGAISSQQFKMVGRRQPQVFDRRCRIERSQAHGGASKDIRRKRAALVIVEPRRMPGTSTPAGILSVLYLYAVAYLSEIFAFAYILLIRDRVY